MEKNKNIIRGFERWLKTLGYAGSTVYASVRFISDFFFYLKSLKITCIEEISSAEIDSYHRHLLKRKNKRHAGGLSQNYIAANISALKRFAKYLQLTSNMSLEVNLPITPAKIQNKTILSLAEITTLYRVCGGDMLGMRDRIMLDIYYGCGLRRSEGINLDVNDVLVRQKLIYIKKAKGYRERYVPIAGQIRVNMVDYLQNARKMLLSGRNETALLISYRGKRITGNALIIRLNKLMKKAGINKQAGLHSLRHSIATHLLQSGMQLEEVSRFLGHTSLESTQIYTHLACEVEI